MVIKHRIAAAAVATAISLASVAAPAMASTSKHWTKTQCSSYTKTFKKNHSHASAKQKSAANKALKLAGCTTTVK
jgi:hypothetical protein